MGRHIQRTRGHTDIGTAGQHSFNLQYIAPGSKPYSIRSPIGRIFTDQLIINLLIAGISCAGRLHIYVIPGSIALRRPFHIGRLIPAAAAGDRKACGMGHGARPSADD
ncbi:hypothetical protein D3C73_1261470 [compost metagenome]